MKDIKQGPTGDLSLNGDGDIEWAWSDEQHGRDILLARKGEYRLSPTVGLGLQDWIDNEKPALLNREITQQLTADGMTVTEITPQLEVKGHY